MPTALVTGITGQDGSYLVELLLAKGYQVHGIVRPEVSLNGSRIEHLRDDPDIFGQTLFLHEADLADATTLRRILGKAHPEELYHLAGQSHVGLSFEIPEVTARDVAMATLALLEICRDVGWPRFYHASSAEIFGSPSHSPQNEQTPVRPVNPYGCAKAFATDSCRVYREAFGAYVCNGIAYNHESPRRGETFVTRKIAAAAERIAAGSGEVLELGNLDAERDWGFAPEYVEAMWLMLQQDGADDYILATGKLTSVREFARAAFGACGIRLEFEGRETEEVGRDRATGRVLLRVNPQLYRAADPVRLVGDPAKARQRLGWAAATAGPDVAKACLGAPARTLESLVLQPGA